MCNDGDIGEGFVRNSYTYSLDTLKEAVKRIEKYLGNNKRFPFLKQKYKKTFFLFGKDND